MPGTIPQRPCVINTFFFEFCTFLLLLAKVDGSFFFTRHISVTSPISKTDKTSEIGNGINCEIHLFVSLAFLCADLAKL
jgi:hypothetical protein